MPKLRLLIGSTYKKLKTSFDRNSRAINSDSFERGIELSPPSCIFKVAVKLKVERESIHW